MLSFNDCLSWTQLWAIFPLSSWSNSCAELLALLSTHIQGLTHKQAQREVYIHTSFIPSLLDWNLFSKRLCEEINSTLLWNLSSHAAISDKVPSSLCYVNCTVIHFMTSIACCDLYFLLSVCDPWFSIMYSSEVIFHICLWWESAKVKLMLREMYNWTYFYLSLIFQAWVNWLFQCFINILNAAQFCSQNCQFFAALQNMWVDVWRIFKFLTWIRKLSCLWMIT